MKKLRCTDRLNSLFKVLLLVSGRAGIQIRQYGYRSGFLARLCPPKTSRNISLESIDDKESMLFFAVR